MSGPKVDTAELRRQELMRLEAAREVRQKLCEEIMDTIRRIDKQCAEVCGLLDEDGGYADNSSEIKKHRDVCKKKLDKLYDRVRAGNEMFDTDAARAELNEIKREFDLQDDIKRSMELIEHSERLQSIKRQNEAMAGTRRRILQDIKENTVAVDDMYEFDTRADAFEQELTQRMNEGEMTGMHKNSILLLLQDLHELRRSGMPADTSCKRLQRLYGQYEKIGALIHSEMDVMRAVYKEYCTQCFDLEGGPAAMSDFSSVAELKEAAEKMRERAKCRLSSEYIKRQIDDVMKKHGYDVVNSELLHEADAKGQALYGVDKDSAINVFVSDEGQVTMRVVGIGFDEDISEQESERLYQQQCAFCSLHPQLTKELEMRGVILHTKKHNPPDKKFNKKIKTRVRTENAAADRRKKELKRQGLRMMHKES